MSAMGIFRQLTILVAAIYLKTAVTAGNCRANRRIERRVEQGDEKPDEIETARADFGVDEQSGKKRRRAEHKNGHQHRSA
jgi:hypothetical protein